MVHLVRMLRGRSLKEGGGSAFMPQASLSGGNLTNVSGIFYLQVVANLSVSFSFPSCDGMWSEQDSLELNAVTLRCSRSSAGNTQMCQRSRRRALVVWCVGVQS